MNTTVTKSHSINHNVRPGFEARRTTITVTANTHHTSDPAIYPPCRNRLVAELASSLGVEPLDVYAIVQIDQIRGGYQATIEGHV